MTHATRTVVIIFVALIVSNLCFDPPTGFTADVEPLRLFIVNSNQIIESKKRINHNDKKFLPALNKLRRDADRALSIGPFSVTDKSLAPPSGDKHDYMSIAPYWWPNPKTPNGLPYLRRDGEINPERDQTSDRKRLDQLVRTVKTLAWGFFFTGKEDYAARAAKLLQIWFIEDRTKMNPHLLYAQAIPGRNQGRGAGIIETHNLPELIDAIGLLSGAKAWNAAEQKSMQDWFNAYLDWLLESAEGKAEATTVNNHGTWYDVQVAAFAAFVGRDELARKVLAAFPARRIAPQIEPDGRQPRELDRTQSWDYCLFNLEAFFHAAAIAEKFGIDIWNYETGDKRSIRKALDWLVPYASGEKKWSYHQISAFEPEKLAPLLRRAALAYHEPDYEKVISRLPKVTGDERWQLLHPKNP